MTEQRPPSPWRLPVTSLLAVMTFNFLMLATVAWILLSGDQRKVYWQSWWVKGGLGIGVIGSLPLLFVAVAVKLGLFPNADPNQLGLDVLFFFSEVLGSLVALFGLLWTHFKTRKACPVENKIETT